MLTFAQPLNPPSFILISADSLRYDVFSEGFKKVAVLLDFVQISSIPPPLPEFGQLVPLFLNANK